MGYTSAYTIQSFQRRLDYPDRPAGLSLLLAAGLLLVTSRSYARRAGRSRWLRLPLVLLAMAAALSGLALVTHRRIELSPEFAEMAHLLEAADAAVRQAQARGVTPDTKMGQRLCDALVGAHRDRYVLEYYADPPRPGADPRAILAAHPREVGQGPASGPMESRR